MVKIGEKTAIIRCEDLSLGYGKEIVLKNIFLKIPQGIFLPFIGPNGAGKTTLLRGILGLLKPKKGYIHTPFRHKPAGYVPQQKSIDSLFPLTVQEIMMMGFYPRLGWWRRPSERDRKILDETLEELKLTEYAHKNYRDLSGGTKQKTLIARALVSGADIFIMDEPTPELDDSSQKEVLNHLLRFVSEQKKTVLIAHHGLNNLSLYASCVCIVNQGEVRIINADEVKKVISSEIKWVYY